MKKISLLVVIILLSLEGYSQISLHFPKPVNKADSIAINLEYTKYCLGKFEKQYTVGSYFSWTGSVIAVGSGVIYATMIESPSKNVKDAFTGIVIGGGVLALVGGIIQTNSFKWFRYSSIQPVLSPYGLGVVINIDSY